MAVGWLMNPLFVFEQSTADEATDKCRKTVVACVKVTSNSSPKLLAVCFMTAMKYAAPTTFFTFGVIHTLQTSEEWNCYSNSFFCWFASAIQRYIAWCGSTGKFPQVTV